MKLTHWIIIGLCAVIALLLLFGGGNNEEHVQKVTALETKVKTREAAIHKMIERDQKKRIKQQQDSVLQAEKEKTYQTRVKKLSAQIARIKANPVVIKVREENPEIDSLIHKQDSVIAEQGERLYESGKYVTQLQIEMTEIRRDFNERIAQQELNIIDQKKIADEYRKELRKKRRGAKLARVLIPIVAAGGFLLGSQL